MFYCSYLYIRWFTFSCLTVIQQQNTHAKLMTKLQHLLQRWSFLVMCKKIHCKHVKQHDRSSKYVFWFCSFAACMEIFCFCVTLRSHPYLKGQNIMEGETNLMVRRLKNSHSDLRDKSNPGFIHTKSKNRDVGSVAASWRRSGFECCHGDPRPLCTLDN